MRRTGTVIAHARKLNVPRSHTGFSWMPKVTSSFTNNGIPRSHTRFSWRLVVQKTTSLCMSTTASEKIGQHKKIGTIGFVDIDANFLSDILLKDGDTAYHVEAASEVGIKRFIVPSTNITDLNSVLNLAKQFVCDYCNTMTAIQ